MAEVPSTRKVQITVPAADTSVTEWLDLQYSPSESIRRLIREAVAREGFVDVANRPVRPPAQPAHVGELMPDDDESAGRPARARRTPAPESGASAGPTPAGPADAERPPRDAAHDEPDAEQDAPPAPAPASAPARTRRERSAPTAASATIDDLLGL